MEQERIAAEGEERSRGREDEALRRYELLVANSRDIILFMRRADGRILEANLAATNAYGYTREELLALTVHGLRADDTRPLTAGQMGLADDRGILFETVHRRKDGSTFPVEVSSRGSSIGGERTLISVVRDITDRKRAEEALRQSEARYRRVFESHVAGFALHELICDGSGVPCDYRFLEVNPAFERLTGLVAADLIGRTVLEALPGVERVWIERYGRVVQSGVPDHFTSRSAALDRHYEVTAYPAGPGQFAVMFVDVSDRVRAQEALREADRRKTEFLAVLSHELRNPLAPIRNSVYLLDRAAPGSEAARRAREVLQRQTEHLTRLVDDLLDMTRITHGKIELQLARLDARDVVRRACDDLTVGFAQRRIDLQCTLPAEPAWVDADAARLTQMVGNLLNNALKFTQAGGQVHVALRDRDGSCQVTVRDNGMGIEPAELDRIFDPFVQAERTRHSAQGGMGIGLALVQEFAVKHRGSVRALSAGPGQGAEFILTLPLAVAPTSAVSRGEARQGVSGLSILIVEDNEDAGATLAELLALAGHQVKVVATGRAGIDTASASPPDVLICDIGLPDLNGHDVIRAIRATGHASAVFAIALTGYAQLQDREQALGAGFDGHLAKPPPLEDLNELLAEAATKKG